MKKLSKILSLGMTGDGFQFFKPGSGVFIASFGSAINSSFAYFSIIASCQFVKLRKRGYLKNLDKGTVFCRQLLIVFFGFSYFMFL